MIDDCAPFDDVPAGDGAASATDSRVDRRRAVARLRDVRRLRARFLPAHLFADPCWDMLLDLYAAELSGERASVTWLSASANLPLTTALRRLVVLEQQGLVVRSEDPDDRRKTLVRLSDAGREAMDRFFSHLVAGD